MNVTDLVALDDINVNVNLALATQKNDNSYELFPQNDMSVD